jgi:hypothetical protein
MDITYKVVSKSTMKFLTFSKQNHAWQNPMRTQLDAKKIMAIVHASVKLGYFKASEIEYSLSSPSSFCAFHSFSDVFDGISKCRRPCLFGMN